MWASDPHGRGFINIDASILGLQSFFILIRINFMEIYEAKEVGALMTIILGQQDSLLPTLELVKLCQSHENMREVIKALLSEIRSPGPDNKTILEQAQRIVE